MTRNAPLLLVIVLLASATAAIADSAELDYLWDHPGEVRVPNENVAFSDTKYAHAKNESIFIMTYFNDGWILMYSIFHLDTRLLDRWGMYALVAEPDGTYHWKTLIVKESEIVIAGDHLYYSDGINMVEDTGEKLHVVCDFDGFSCDLEFEKLMPAWQPGTGRDDYSEDGEYFQYKAVFVPWADVNGRIETDGIKLRVAGYGYGEKTLFVNPLTWHQPYLHALRLYTPRGAESGENWHIAIHEVVLNERFGLKRIPRLTVARDGNWVFTTRDYVFEPVETGTLEGVPYEYGTKFSLHVEKDGYRLDGVFKERVFFHFTDIFENLPLWVKNILVVFFKRPVYFRYVAQFKGEMIGPDGVIHDLEMGGPYEYVVVY
ncbi:MAG: hypothetical protein JW852_04300 [Spirochaetales bacterium]|nr:hypothetical protein [Spirochaetales bacterium]